MKTFDSIAARFGCVMLVTLIACFAMPCLSGCDVPQIDAPSADDFQLDSAPVPDVAPLPSTSPTKQPDCIGPDCPKCPGGQCPLNGTASATTAAACPTCPMCPLKPAIISDATKQGVGVCCRCKKPTVGQQWHSLWTSDGDVATYMCADCWRETSPEQHDGFLRLTLQKAHVTERSQQKFVQALHNDPVFSH